MINPENCEVPRASIQELMNQGIIMAEHLSTIKDITTF